MRFTDWFFNHWWPIITLILLYMSVFTWVGISANEPLVVGLAWGFGLFNLGRLAIAWKSEKSK